MKPEMIALTWELHEIVFICMSLKSNAREFSNYMREPCQEGDYETFKEMLKTAKRLIKKIESALESAGVDYGQIDFDRG